MVGITDIVGKCRICQKEISREQLTTTELNDSDKAVYHDSVGVVCLSHLGVKEVFESILKKAGAI